MKKENEALLKAESISGNGKEKKETAENTEPTAKETNAVLKEEKRAIEERKGGKDVRKLKRFKIACAVLAVSVVALTGGLLYKSLAKTESDVMLDAAYRRSLYDVTEQVGSIDLNLSKAIATKDSAAMSGYLLDAAIESELAESDIHDLPIKDENKVYTTKLINQIGDFTKMLNKKIARGESVTEEEYATLEKLREYNRKLKDALDEFIGNSGDGYEFNINADNGDALLSGLNQLENLSVEYPELIYDGPFSDGLLKREIKGLSGDNITSSEAKDIFSELFAEYNPQNIEVGKSVNADIPCYNVSASIKGKPVLAQISETGGKLIMYSQSGSCNAAKYEFSAAEKKAEEFLSSLGIENMKPVWYVFYNNSYTINYAGIDNGAVVYPDMIKIKLCAETSDIIGFEATTYYKNHTERTVGSPALSKRAAKEKVSDSIEVETVRLAVIPFGNDSERLCYEFSGKKDGDTYYAYIDAQTGAQLNMFKVIESTEGTLLM